MSPADLAGLHVVADGSLQRHQDGMVLLGGSPLRVMRLTAAGARTVDRLLDGEPVPSGGAASALVRRLLDSGMVQPADDPSPFALRDITVVIPVRGELPPALVQSFAGIAAIVVVDDASESPIETPDRNDRGVPVTLLRRTVCGGPGAARNTGLHAVTTPLVAFIDADCEPTDDWLARLLPLFADPVVAMAAPRIIAPELVGRQSVLTRYEHARSALDLGDEPGRVRARTRLPFVPSAALLARAEVLRELDGFDERMPVGEDVDLAWRLDEADWSVRYAPAATVAHRHRTHWWAWARRRFDYGTSAGPLAARHPGALVPIEASPWSAAGWGLAITGHHLSSAVVVGATTVLLSGKLDSLDQPLPISARLAAQGHLAAGRQFSEALLRPFWPLTLLALAAMPGRHRHRRRLALLVAALTPSIVDWVRDRPPLDPISYVACRVADDMAYSTGVWVGAIRARRAEPLVPELSSWPQPSRYTRWRTTGRTQRAV